MEACLKIKNIFSLKLQSLDTDMSHESGLRSYIGISNHAFCQSALGTFCLIGVTVEGAHTWKKTGPYLSDRLHSTDRVLAKVKLRWKHTEDNVIVQAQIYFGVKLQEETVYTAAHAKSNKIYNHRKQKWQKEHNVQTSNHAAAPL